MLDDVVLRVERLGKLYSRSMEQARGRVGLQLLYSAIGLPKPPKAEPKSKADFWALDDINFELKRGGSLGIIGLNGSGKTTLLRMLAGQILPDRGLVSVHGKTASMIDLTAGFDPTRSGADNIFLRGAALGRSVEELTESYDAIVDFSELDEAINAPLDTYSSGMKMRLAFSIMMASAPDILFIDEVLSVGDFRFRQKCLARLREVRASTSFVLVSHSMSDVRSFCDEVIVMQAGRCVFRGAPNDAIEASDSLQLEGPPSRAQRLERILAPQFANETALRDVEFYWCDASGARREHFSPDQQLCFHLSFVSDVDIRRMIVGIPIWREDGTYVTGLSTDRGEGAPPVAAGERVVLRMNVDHNPLNEGEYVSNVTVLDGPEMLIRVENHILTIERRREPSWGLVSIPNRWQRL